MTGRNVGIQVGGSAGGDISGSTVRDSALIGVLFADQSGGRFTDRDVSASASVGVLAGGTTAPDITSNTISGGGAGMVFRDDTVATVGGNTVSGNAVSAQIEARAAPLVVGNIGVQVGGASAPTVTNNVINGAGQYGLLFLDAGGGSVASNTVTGFQLGVQLSGYAAPSVTGNILNEQSLAAIAYAEGSGGSVSANSCTNPGIPGIVVAPSATPTIGRNGCTLAQLE